MALADLVALGEGVADALLLGVGDADLLGVGVGVADLLALGVGVGVGLGGGGGGATYGATSCGAPPAGAVTVTAMITCWLPISVSAAVIAAREKRLCASEV